MLHNTHVLIVNLWVLTKMNFFDKISGILSNPKKKFNDVEKETFSQPFLFYITILLLTNVITTFYYLIEYQIPNKWYIVIYLASITFTIAMLFVSLGLVHCGIKIVKGKGGFTKTSIAYIYGTIPSLIGGFITMALLVTWKRLWVFFPVMLIGLGTFVYSVYLTIIGFSQLHKISNGKAAFAYFFPFLIIFGLTTIIIIIAFIFIVLLGGIY
jgi:hypothetical protein